MILNKRDNALWIYKTKEELQMTLVSVYELATLLIRSGTHIIDFEVTMYQGNEKGSIRDPTHKHKAMLCNVCGTNTLIVAGIGLGANAMYDISDIIDDVTNTLEIGDKIGNMLYKYNPTYYTFSKYEYDDDDDDDDDDDVYQSINDIFRPIDDENGTT